MNKINFNKNWSFSLNKSEEKTIIDLPHDFSIIQERKNDAPSGVAGGWFLGGYGVYEKTFTAKKGKKHFFMCDGSFGITEIHINGNLVYINKYGYNSFYCDLTDYIRYNEQNQLTVKVNNNSTPSARWYTGSGIYRDAFLCVSDECYLSPYGIFAYADKLMDETAYMRYQARVFSNKKGEGVLDFQVFEDGTKKPILEFKKYFYATEGENVIDGTFQIENAKIWDIDKPNLYKIKAKMTLNGSQDSEESVFGIRTLIADYKRGLFLNGKSIKLRGGCIHHDHGPVGARVYKESEFRRVAKLKEAGYNAIRLSHNPQSPYLYEACDRLGMLVIDELFDYWTEGKLWDDFHAHFEDNYEKWTKEIVLKNRNHPSIIMWSTGNEIPQKAGRGYGYKYARNIADKIRELDTSRPLTIGLCSLWDNNEQYELENATKHLGSDKMDYFAEKTAITGDTVDILGYNYLEYRLENDLERFKNKLFMNTETYPFSAYTTTKQLENNPRIIGDFVWTAWDYFGETGIGRVDYYEGKWPSPMERYPYHIASCGDIDICGNRRVQSYYREISWGLRKEPYLATRHPEKSKIPQFPSVWGFYECEPSWAYEGYEGMESEIFAFGECDELSIEINGKEVARQKKTENGIYKFKLKYEKGEICAKAYENGKLKGSYSIKTEGKADKLKLEKEKSYITKKAEKPLEDIIYINAKMVDKNGMLCTQNESVLTLEIQGGEILGTANGHLTDTTLYTSNKRALTGGKMLVVVKKTDKNATLTAKIEGFSDEIIEL